MSWLQPLNPPLRNWRGKRVWIVGASSGIGAALAHALHDLGAEVHVSARNQQSLADLCDGHLDMRGWPLDVRDPQQVDAAAQSVWQAGRVDLVVYCAGYYRPTSASNFDLAEMKRHDEVNYVGALHVLASVLPALLRQGSGHVSLVSSVAGYRGLPRSLAYGPTKAALTHLAQALYLDLHPQGIGVSAVHPGFVATALTAQNEFRMPALIEPAQAAAEMIAGWRRGEFDIHFPKRFTRAMKLASMLPFRTYGALVRKVTA
jgi:NAD(P)-dependent dehydrogenase (short-subunit alcohol dehydrogenase family)